MNTHGDQLSFRQWLVKQLTLTRWSAPLDASPVELAVKLGVRLDVLREAQGARDAEMKKRGQAGVARGRRRYVGSDYADYRVHLSKPIEADWQAICETLQIARGTVLRSLIHHFLLHPVRPSVTGRTWCYRGRKYPISRIGNPKVCARVPRGAQIAFDHYADEWNVTPSGLLRGLITDFLEGRTRKFQMVTFAELWGDPDRYLHPEKFK